MYSMYIIVKWLDECENFSTMSYPYRNNKYYDNYDSNYRPKKKKYFDRYNPRYNQSGNGSVNGGYNNGNSHGNSHGNSYNNYNNDTYYGRSNYDSYLSDRRHSHDGYVNERRIKPAFDLNIKARLSSPSKHLDKSERKEEEREKEEEKEKEKEKEKEEEKEKRENRRVPKIDDDEEDYRDEDKEDDKEVKHKEDTHKEDSHKEDEYPQEADPQVEPQDQKEESLSDPSSEPKEDRPEDKPEDRPSDEPEEKPEAKNVKFTIPESPVYDELSEDSEAETVISESAPSTSNSTKLLKDLHPEKSKRPYVLKRDASGSSLLQRACKKGNFEEVKDLIERGANPNESDFCGFTCLHEAALNGNVEIVKYLIEKGADVNKQALPDGDLETPLIDAADNKHLEIVKILLDNGADPRIFNNDGFTALTKIHNLHEDEEGYDEIIKLLEEANNKFLEKIDSHSKQDPTELKSSYQKSPSPNAIIEDPNDNYFLDILRKKSHSSLIFKYAAEGIKDLTAQYIVEGGRLDYKPDILILAARNGHVELVDIILGLVEDYDINLTNNVGLSALLASVGRGHFKVVEFLLERGANPFLRRRQDGLNALEISQRSANFDTKEIELIEKFMKKNPNYSLLSKSKENLVEEPKIKEEKKERKELKRKSSSELDDKKLKKTKSSDEMKLKKVKSREESGIKPTTSTLFKREKTPDVEPVTFKTTSPSPPPISQQNSQVNLSKQISNTSNDTPEPITKEQEELRAKTARDLKIYQEKLEAKKKAKRDLFLKSEKEKERKRKEEELQKIEEEKQKKELAIKEEKNKINKIKNEVKKIELAKTNLVRKLINDNYPLGLKKFKFGLKTDAKDILKFTPIYKLKINDEIYVADLQILLVTGLTIKEISSKITHSLPTTVEDKSKLWNLFAPLIGTNENLISRDLLVEGYEKFKYLDIKLVRFTHFEEYLKEIHGNIYDILKQDNSFITVDFKYLNVFEPKVKFSEIQVNQTNTFTPPSLQNKPHLIKLIKEAKTPLWN